MGLLGTSTDGGGETDREDRQVFEGRGSEGGGHGGGHHDTRLSTKSFNLRLIGAENVIP